MLPQTLTALPKASLGSCRECLGHVKQPQGRCVLRPEGTGARLHVLACPCPQGLTQNVSDHQSVMVNTAGPLVATVRLRLSRNMDLSWLFVFTQPQ